MKKKLLQIMGILLLGLLVGISGVMAQTGYREKEEIDYLPEAEIHETLQRLRSLRTTLPERVDHSSSKYMSSIVNQGSMGSCGSASRICYMFAYEINNYRNLNGKLVANRYPSHFTWMLTGQNSDKENMAIFNGIPSVSVYGATAAGAYQYNPVYGGNVGWPDAYPQYGWMNGYDKWRSAMDNRLEKTANIQLSTDEAIEYLKWWIYNHHGDDSFNEGGVAGGGAATGGWVTTNIPAGSYKAGELIVTSYGNTIDHGVTWSGYDDNIEFDLNGDGEITDDERGALIMLNSWGNWGNNGCVYVPYKLVKSYGGGLGAELYYIRKDYKPLDVFRIKMDYNERCNIKISIGVSSDPEAVTPDKTIVAEHFNYAGFDPIPLLGKYNGVINEESMEFGLDLTDLISVGFDTRENFKYFLLLDFKAATTGEGEVSELEVIRHDLEDSEKDPQVVGKIDAAVTLSGNKQIIIPVDVPGTDAIAPDYLYIPQSSLSVRRVSSQESSAEDGRARNTLDNNPSTFWHTAYSSGTPSFPHWITFQIDSTYTLTGFEYLPRQGHSNGRIGDYEFYVSEVADEDGVLVSSGTFENNSNAKRAFFEGIQGKYVKIVNKKAANGDGNTCMAEFNLFYTPKTTDIPSTIPTIGEESSLIIQQEESVLRISGVIGETVFSLYNIQGQKVLEKSTSVTFDTKTELNVASFTKGVYILQVLQPDQTQTKKVLIN